MTSASRMTQKTRKITTTAVMVALIFVVTWLVKFPVPVSGGAYLNLGDVVIYMCAFILGGPAAAIAAAIGSSLADVAIGSAVYALPTLLIKAAMGFSVGILTKRQTFSTYALACIAGGALMTLGYAWFEYVFFGAAYTAAALPFNLIQWAGGTVVAILFFKITKRLSLYFNFRGHQPIGI